MRPGFLNRSRSLPEEFIISMWKSMSLMVKVSIISGPLMMTTMIIVGGILVSQAIEHYRTTPEAPPIQTIIVDPEHRVQVYDSATQRSWDGFIYRGQLVLIPGTELDLSVEEDKP